LHWNFFLLLLFAPSGQHSRVQGVLHSDQEKRRCHGREAQSEFSITISYLFFSFFFFFQIISNWPYLIETIVCDDVQSFGYKLVTDGTDNHLVLWDLRPNNFTGSKMQRLCDELSITLNKNSVAGDTSALVPGGVRVGAYILFAARLTK
jgi:hypothetical protein